ncbi:MAG: bifunctional diguanylate cyclase/phosphodiesterase [Actinomycetota bacterium]
MSASLTKGGTSRIAVASIEAAASPKRRRVASLGLLLILLLLSGFAVWSSFATSSASSAAARESVLSDDYTSAATAIGKEDSNAYEYQLRPEPAGRRQLAAARSRFVESVGFVRRHGDPTDRALVAGLLGTHDQYLTQIDRVLAATDRGDLVGAAQIDTQVADLLFDGIVLKVDRAAADQRNSSLVKLARLQRLEEVTNQLTPLVFLLGILLAAVLASINRGFNRILDVARTQAIHDSRHDSLTGLPNRMLLSERFTQALSTARDSSNTAALLLIDLDRFKEINDTFGHEYGDQLLQQIGPRLTEAVRDDDTVARLGGDEFGVLLPQITDVQAATEVARKLLSALERPFLVSGVQLDIEASIGVVLSGVHAWDAPTLLQHADIAMYVAKAQNLGVFAYDPALDGHSPGKLALLGELRRALEREELELYYQPKISISTGDVLGAEALVRWQHPDRGMIPPDDFIPLAERTGLIGPLTQYVLDHALCQAALWLDTGRPLPIAVNLSARNLLDERLPGLVAGLLQTHGVPAHLLELEVTESALMTEPGTAKRLLEQLTRLGLRIAVDDFGAGFTSLGQLKDLPISELKIDRSFVMTMTEDKSNALIVQSVIDLGHNLGLTIIAEGVETAQQLNALASYGCDVAQGYHLSRPMPVSAFDTWYAARPRIVTPVVST